MLGRTVIDRVIIVAWLFNSSFKVESYCCDRSETLLHVRATRCESSKSYLNFVELIAAYLDRKPASSFGQA